MITDIEKRLKGIKFLFGKTRKRKMKTLERTFCRSIELWTGKQVRLLQYH